MSEVHRYSVVKMLSEAGNKISYDPHGPEVVMAKDYDALSAKLAVVEDAASKGDAARHAAGGMEMEIQELRENVAELKKELRSRWTYASTQATNCAGCGEHKHTPLRVDWMGGYVCLTCIDEKLEALRARVVVVPERKLLNAGVPGLNRNSGWNACLDELARLNGKTVSEWLLRQLLDSDGIDGIFDAQQNYAAHQELRALLGEQEGGRQ
ncbi:hypothetical protein [Pseudomonas aeruginosa]|uniref:hypothetical protein n=1 Tax=Pseudomonas aeruginosa TaxID=287 RepID=UPI00071B302E|nr:hypothetical protein [Pseudomonas aeruginosa]KSQ07349.1 hypothetical protein APB22_00075 [Pseudomonas aeruginosa]RPV11645.1 hypothetical protein IPC867_03490 [Pseudomonas aeruginosa]